MRSDLRAPETHGVLEGSIYTTHRLHSRDGSSAVLASRGFGEMMGLLRAWTRQESSPANLRPDPKSTCIKG